MQIPEDGTLLGGSVERSSIEPSLPCAALLSETAMSTNKAFFGRVQLQHLAVANLIQWGDQLSVDHPGIDAQHEAIFGLGARVYDSWRSGGGVAVLRPAVDKLANLLRAHFFYEEQLLTEIGYDGLKQHVAEHNSMLNELESLQGRFHSFSEGQPNPGGSVLAPGWSVMQFVLEFTIGHVMTSDMSYCQALSDSRNWLQGTA